MSVKQIFNTSAELDFPNVLPTLDLDFANSKTLDPRITFTRASGGSYVGADGLIKYAGVNEARFDHDPVTGESLGLLIEEARQNIIRRSQDFTIAVGYWDEIGDGLTITSNQATAPDGTLTADKVSIKTTGLGEKGIQSTILNSSIASQAYTVSIFLKAAEHPFVRVQFQGGGNTGGINVNLNNGSLISLVGNPTSYSIVPYPNNWYRIVITNTTTNTNASALRWFLVDSNGSNIFAGTVGKGVYAWGAQFEQGPLPTSYIPTQGSTRTRAADFPRIIGKNFSEWYRQDEGTIFMDFKNTPNFNLFPYCFSITGDSGINVNRIAVTKFQDPTNIRISDIKNSIGQSAYNIGTGYLSGTNIKFCRTYGFKDFIGSVNGETPQNQVLTTPNASPFQQMTLLSIGITPNITSCINAPVKRFTYYPKRLPNSQLQSLTS